MMNNGLVKALCRDAAIYACGVASQKVVVLILLPIYLSCLTPAEFAILDLLILINGFLIIAMTLGIDSGFALLVTRDGVESARNITSSCLAAQVFWGAIVLSASYASMYIAVFFDIIAINFADLLMMITVAAVFQGFILFAVNLFKWVGRPIPFILITIGSGVTTVFLSLWFLVLNSEKVYGAIHGIMISAIICSFVGLIWMRPYYFGRPELSIMRKSIVLGIPVVASSLLIAAQPIILRALAIDALGAQEAGVFAAAQKLTLSLGLIAQAFNMAWGPTVLKHSSDINRQYMADASRWLAALLVIAGSFIVACSPLIFVVILRHEYTASSSVFGVLIIAVFIQSWKSVVSFGLFLSQRTVWLPIIGACQVFAIAITVGPACMVAGKIGLACDVVIIELVSALATLWAAQRDYRIPYRLTIDALLLATLALVAISDFALQEHYMGFYYDVAARLVLIITSVIPILIAFFWSRAHKWSRKGG